MGTQDFGDGRLNGSGEYPIQGDSELQDAKELGKEEASIDQRGILHQ
jgi:hypothetical protein